MNRHTRAAPIAILTSAAVLLAGCMPGWAKVDHGAHPEKIDEKVRFRTTYYFRVFGDCYQANGASDQLPEYSGLYRFRMTGKASSLTNKVRFESGILPASAIDPFGVSLRYDENTDSLLFTDARLEEKTRVAKELISLVEKLQAIQTKLTSQGGAPDPSITKSFDQALTAVIAETARLIADQGSVSIQQEMKRLVEAHQALLNMSKQQELSVEQKKEFEQQARQRLDSALTEVVHTATRLAQARACTNNDQGFMILGPEGWRQFRPDERLIMAMYSSGHPVIATLNELSARALTVDANSAEVQLVFSKENQRIVKSLGTLNDFDPERPSSGPSTLDNAMKALAGEQSP